MIDDALHRRTHCAAIGAPMTDRRRVTLCNADAKNGAKAVVMEGDSCHVCLEEFKMDEVSLLLSHYGAVGRDERASLAAVGLSEIAREITQCGFREPIRPIPVRHNM